MAYGYRKPQDLPATIPVFPLARAVLFPRAGLPLNIFEPRYLNMIDDALRGDRLIGMVQPTAQALDEAHPPLAPVGCVGRVTTFSETDDGRYLVTLTGVARFRIMREIEAETPYRQVEADFASFARDLAPPPSGFAIDREELSEALRRYVDSRGFQVDWDAVSQAPPELLINAIAALCPFDVMEKQALLEADELHDRCATLVALLELNAAGDGEDPPLQ